MANPNHVPLFAGLEKGIFAKHGVNLEIRRLHDMGDTYPFLSSGQAQLALSTMPQALQAADRGHQIRCAGTLFNRPLVAFIVREDSEITCEKDLSGKVLGAAFGAFTCCVLKHYEAQHQICFAQRYRVAFDLVGILATEQVDAIFAYQNIEPMQLEALGIPARVLPVAPPDIPDYHDVVVMCREDFDQRVAFQEALKEAIQYCLEEPDEAFDLYLTANPEKGEFVQSWERESWKQNLDLLARSQKIDSQLWISVWQWLDAQGYAFEQSAPDSGLTESAG